MSQVLTRQLARFFVAGKPAGQPRPRARARAVPLAPGKWTARVYQPTRVKGKPVPAVGWRQRVEAASLRVKERPREPLTAAVRVDVVYYLPRPQYLMRGSSPPGPVPMTAKPDRDNLDKPVLDALTDAGWWRDDAQVFAGESIKVYHSKGGQPGAWITISVVDDGERGLFEESDDG